MLPAAGEGDKPGGFSRPGGTAGPGVDDPAVLLLAALAATTGDEDALAADTGAERPGGAPGSMDAAFWFSVGNAAVEEGALLPFGAVGIDADLSGEDVADGTADCFAILLELEVRVRDAFADKGGRSESLRMPLDADASVADAPGLPEAQEAVFGSADASSAELSDDAAAPTASADTEAGEEMAFPAACLAAIVELAGGTAALGDLFSRSRAVCLSVLRSSFVKLSASSPGS